MDLCTQAHDIIRTWLFSRVVRVHYEHGVAPWSHALISGFILDPDRKKMSKSKGNAVVPTDVLDKYGADAVRWRAAMARPGLDSPFDESQMKVGRRLAMKVLNASKFVLGSVGATDPDPFAVSEPVDCALLARLAGVVTARPRRSRPTTTPRRSRSTEQFFWEFCDDYLELVKERAYAEDGATATASARATLALAPCRSSCACWRRSCPTSPRRSGRGGRRARSTTLLAEGDRARLRRGRGPDDDDAVAAALTGIRGAKSQAKVSMRAELSRVEITGPGALVRGADSPRPTCARPARSPATWS